MIKKKKNTRKIKPKKITVLLNKVYHNFKKNQNSNQKKEIRFKEEKIKNEIKKIKLKENEHKIKEEENIKRDDVYKKRSTTKIKR